MSWAQMTASGNKRAKPTNSFGASDIDDVRIPTGLHQFDDGVKLGYTCPRAWGEATFRRLIRKHHTGERTRPTRCRRMDGVFAISADL